MSSTSRKLASLALPALAVLALAACGSSHSKVTTGTYAGESGASAPYLDVGPLTYEVQLSRALNPYNVEDASYLQALTPTQRQLSTGEGWFAVFIQVYNNASHPYPAASGLTLHDALGNVFGQVIPGPSNEFAYRGGVVPAGGRIPVEGSVAASGPTQGSMLLFKIPLASLDNRPLKLRIVSPTDAAHTAMAELDV
jgi:hypothetical protein